VKVVWVGVGEGRVRVGLVSGDYWVGLGWC
jgi:hypothetical protein